MTPAAARDMWKRRIYKDGEPVTLRRVNPQPQQPTQIAVMARVLGYAPEELTGGIQQGDRKVFILAEDVERSGFPVPFRSNAGDSIVIRNRQLIISVVDDNTHRLGGVLIAYEMRVTN